MEDLRTYPRPNVAVDLAVLTLTGVRDAQGLAVLVLERAEPPTGLVLPGRFLREGETVADCARVALWEKADIDLPSLEPSLLRVFDDPGRDPRGWTLSLAHYLAVPATSVSGRLVPVDSLPPLLFDHERIVEEATTRLRESYELQPDPQGLMAEPFTLADLRELHQAILGEPIKRDTFRRRMEPQLTAHKIKGEQSTRTDGGRPARLWNVHRTNQTQSVFTDRVRLPRDS